MLPENDVVVSLFNPYINIGNCIQLYGGSEETTPSGGSGGGSGGGSSITAYAVKLWLALYPETPVSWSIDKTNIAITQLDISVKNQIRVPKITIENMTEKPSSISAASGKVHQYLNITPQNIAEADLKSVKLTFRVERAWLTDNNIDENTVSLNRYSNGVWNKLATSRTTTEDATYVYYQAETPGFSIFAITGESKVSGEEQGEVTTTTIQTTTTIPSEVSSSEPIKLPIWMPLIIFLIIIVGVGFILKGRINSSKKI